jgi:hypothetical protein
MPYLIVNIRVDVSQRTLLMGIITSPKTKQLAVRINEVDTSSSRTLIEIEALKG